MADSYRLTVLKRLTAHLRGITKANGYDYDLIDPRSVCRGRLVFGDDDPLPLLSILEGTRSDIGSFAGHGERKEHWPLTIQGWVADDVDNPTDPAYGLLDAVERHLQRLTKVSSVNGVEIYPDKGSLQISGTDTILPSTYETYSLDEIMRKFSMTTTHPYIFPREQEEKAEVIIDEPIINIKKPVGRPPKRV